MMPTLFSLESSPSGIRCSLVKFWTWPFSPLRSRGFKPASALVAACFVAALALATPAQAYQRTRTPVKLPDLPDYLTLKCDFHIHTVFSDGSVWPDVRAEEAWREGLDAIAITDHIEYQPHKDDVPTKHNRPYEIAKPHGDTLRVTVIRGSEITRKMPPGHLNAIFLKDAKALETEAWRDALAEARRQGAFIFWNHPGWTGQQPDGKARWYPEHTELFDQGLLQGIEVVNSREYYPEAHAWALEKNLTLMSNSDIHSPIHLSYDLHESDRRPMTLVFARENTAAAIHEALLDRRTAVYANQMLIGREPWVRPLFERSIRLCHPEIAIRGQQRVYLQIQNDSDLDYTLELANEIPELTAARSLTLPAGKTVLLDVRGKSDTSNERRELQLDYRVKNVLVAPNEPLVAHLRFTVQFRAK